MPEAATTAPSTAAPAAPRVPLAKAPKLAIATIRLPAWSRPMELAFAFLLGAGVMFLGHLAWRQTFGPVRPAELLLPVALDLNLADEAELAQLPGLGPQRARRIVEHRERHGKFQSLDELNRVEGVGGYLVDKLRPAVRIGGERASLPTPSTGLFSDARGVMIDLNLASREELQRLPGIGPVLADRIVTHREVKGPFSRVEELGRIHGIKAKTIEKVRPFVRIEPPPPKPVSPAAS